jgi:hypothetical protein
VARIDPAGPVRVAIGPVWLTAAIGPAEDRAPADGPRLATWAISWGWIDRYGPMAAAGRDALATEIWRAVATGRCVLAMATDLADRAVETCDRVTGIVRFALVIVLDAQVLEISADLVVRALATLADLVVQATTGRATIAQVTGRTSATTTSSTIAQAG